MKEIHSEATYGGHLQRAIDLNARDKRFTLLDRKAGPRE
jgi:hypothetical protein